MMKPYKGIVRITCTVKTCLDKLKEPVATCVNCDSALVEIVDFEDKTIAEKIINRQTGKQENRRTKKSSKE